ncbi:MAG: sensor histidine kinase [Candidatus Helarchaeota archaeon]
MLEEEILNLIIAVYSMIAAVICIYSSFKNPTLKPWIPAVSLFGIGALLEYLTFINGIFQMLGNLFYLFALLWLIIIVFWQYYHLHSEELSYHGRVTSVRKNIIVAVLFLSGLTPLEMSLFSIRFIILVLEIIACFMSLRIYQIKRSPTHAFMFLTLLGAAFTLFSALLNNLAIPGMWELSYVTNFIFITFIAVTAFIAQIETHLIESERSQHEAFKRVDLYKNLFAHDINNILQNIQLSYDLLATSQISPENRNSDSLLKNIKEQIVRGHHLLSNIQNLSILEEGEIFLEKTEAIGILRESISYVQTSFPRKTVKIAIDCDEAEIFVKANSLLFEVFENLLLNGIKYNRNPVIVIQIIISNEILNKKNFVKFQFIDNGIGIKDKRKKTLFQRIDRNHLSTTGMGLGLLLVKQIIERYSGKIWVEDRVPGDQSKGSNFILLIPKA